MMLITPSGTGNGVGMGVAVGVGVDVEVGDTIGIGDERSGVLVGSELGSMVGSGALDELAGGDPPPQAPTIVPITAVAKMMDDILFTKFFLGSGADTLSAWFY